MKDDQFGEVVEPAQVTYFESLRMPSFMVIILGLIIGVISGMLTGFALRDFIGKGPLIEGAGALIFYSVLSFVLLVLIFVFKNFFRLEINVDKNGFHFNYGVFSRSFSWVDLEYASVEKYNWKTYGGWGIRRSKKGRWAWSQLGVSNGVLIGMNKQGNLREYYVSSDKPNILADLLNQNIKSYGSLAKDEK